MRKPISRKEWNKLNQHVKDVLKMARTHDPDLVKWLRGLDRRVVNQAKALLEIQSDIETINHQLERIGAPQYRRIINGSRSKIATVEATVFATKGQE
jgi:hypothetical protein